MQLLREFTDNVSYISEGEGSLKKMYIEGPTLVAEKVNGNKRKYLAEGMRRGVKKHLNEFFNSDRAVGELNHPDINQGQINLDNVSHRFVEVNEDSANNIWNTKSLLLQTRSGKQAQNLIEGGVKLGISSRAFGSMQKQDGISIISEVHFVSLGDLVANPSAPGAFMNAVMENKEWIFENGVFVEKDISENIDSYKKIINNSTKRERSKLMVEIFSNYMKLISST